MAADPCQASVVIPAYNRAALVERALRSVDAQTLKPAEVIVVDDGSSDGTAQRAEALGARVVRHESNRGKSAARNTGVEAASNEWIAFLDCDDEWLPQHLATVWPARDSHVLVGTVMITDADPPRLYGWPGPSAEVVTNPAAASLPENKVNTSTVLAQRDHLIAAGGFPDLDFAEDMHLWLRVLERGSGLLLPDVTGIYHWHEDQASSVRERMWDARRDVVLAFRDRPWCTKRVIARHEAAIAWDSARAELADGASRPATFARLASRLASPTRMRGLAALLAYRRGVRRASALQAERPA